MFSAVRYQVFNVIRSGKVRGKYEQSYLPELAIENIAEDKLQDEAIVARLNLGLETLPPRCKEIFTLSRFEFLSHKQIAEKLGVSEKTVENQITIALKKLRVHLKDFILLLLVFGSNV